MTTLKHGFARRGKHTAEFKTWTYMKRRCCQPTHKDYKNYGGRGIKICDRWLNDFTLFLADMGPKPSEKHSIDRIDVNGNYEPSNCRWASFNQQARNKRPRKSSSGFRGVARRKNGFYSCLYKHKYIASSTDVEYLAKLYDKAVFKDLGRDGKFNFPELIEQYEQEAANEIC